LFKSYVDEGLTPIAKAKETLSDNEKLKKVVRKGINPVLQPPEVYSDRHDGKHPRYHRDVYSRNTILMLLKGIDGFTKDEHGEIIATTHAENLLGKFIDFVVIKES